MEPRSDRIELQFCNSNSNLSELDGWHRVCLFISMKFESKTKTNKHHKNIFARTFALAAGMSQRALFPFLSVLELSSLFSLQFSLSSRFSNTVRLNETLTIAAFTPPNVVSFPRNPSPSPLGSVELSSCFR